MNTVLALHIAGGSLAVIGGFSALFAPKGAWLHRNAGMLFVYAMLLLGVSAAVIGAGIGKNGNALAGAFVAYLVFTAWMTVRPPQQNGRRIELMLMVLGFAVGAVFVAGGIAILRSGSPLTNGVPTPMIGTITLLNGIVALLGAIGDARVIRHGPLRGAPRLSRHLWRMCFALWVASGSFFLGGDRVNRVIPEPLRIGPVLWFLAVLPLLAMFYWLWRTRARKARVLASVSLRPPADQIMARVPAYDAASRALP